MAVIVGVVVVIIGCVVVVSTVSVGVAAQEKPGISNGKIQSICWKIRKILPLSAGGSPGGPGEGIPGGVSHGDPRGGDPWPPGPAREPPLGSPGGGRGGF